MITDIEDSNRGMAMKLFESVRCVGKKVVFEFKTERDAEVFRGLYESPKTGSEVVENTHTKVERRGRWVAIYFATEAEARIKAAICEYPENYRHPIETQGKRCKSCD